MTSTTSLSGHASRPVATSSIAVRFQRGGHIVCADPAQARTIVAHHLERARRNGVVDRVVSAPEGLLAGMPCG